MRTRIETLKIAAPRISKAIKKGSGGAVVVPVLKVLVRHDAPREARCSEADSVALAALRPGRHVVGVIL